MSSYQHNFYLTLRPVSEEISEVEPFVKTLLEPTGMDHASLRQRLTGSALQVSALKMKEGMLNLINAEGTSIAVLSGKEKCLLVMSTMEFKKIQSKRTARKAMTVTTTLPPEDILKIIFASQ